MKFLVSAFGQIGWKISDCVLVLCHKLHIRTYNRPNFSGDPPTFEDPWPPLLPPKLQVLEPPLPREVAVDFVQSKSELKNKLLEFEGHMYKCPIAGDANVGGASSD